MNFFAGLLMFFGGLITLGIVRGIVALLTRGRGGFVTGTLIPLLVLVGIIVVGSAYLDNNGEIVPGTVMAKNEEINTYDTGTYNRYLNVDVQFQPKGDALPTTQRLPVDSALFDQLHTEET